MAAVDVVNDYLQGLPGGARRLAHAEWGLSIPAETLGEPFDVGLSDRSTWASRSPTGSSA